MGRNFPPADETGAADPFIIARCQGKKAKSSVKFETLNPGYFETLEMIIDIPPLGDKRVSNIGINSFSSRNLESVFWLTTKMKVCLEEKRRIY